MIKGQTVELVFKNDTSGKRVAAFLASIGCESPVFKVQQVTNHAFDEGRADLETSTGRVVDYNPRMQSLDSMELPFNGYYFRTV